MFQCEFSNFFEYALDFMWSLEMTLGLEAAIKGWRVTGSVMLLVTHVSLAEGDN